MKKILVLTVPMVFVLFGCSQSPNPAGPLVVTGQAVESSSNYAIKGILALVATGPAGPAGIPTQLQVMTMNGNLVRVVKSFPHNYLDISTSDLSPDIFVNDMMQQGIYALAKNQANPPLRLLFKAWDPRNMSVSWDGTRLVYEVFNGPSAENGIFTFNSNGSNRVRIAHSTYGDFNPVWTPDNKVHFLRFTGADQIACNLMQANPNGTGLVKLRSFGLQASLADCSRKWVLVGLAGDTKYSLVSLDGGTKIDLGAQVSYYLNSNTRSFSDTVYFSPNFRADKLIRINVANPYAPAVSIVFSGKKVLEAVPITYY